MTNFHHDDILVQNTEKTSPTYKIIHENNDYCVLENQMNKDIVFKFKQGCNKKILKIYKKLTGEKPNEI